jgi:CheY-like chemotaxis protein
MSLNLPGQFIVVDPSQIQQIVLNLAVNARDAMPLGGMLRLATSVRPQDGAGSGEKTEILSWIDLIIADSGHGMDIETQKRVFEPFFTTKPLGRGTGLGLSTVYGIVQQCGGRIEVDSQPGAGTEFRISFPLVEVARLEVNAAEIARIQRGSECILVVEDEEDLRELYQEVLTELGYRVFTAENGRRALDIIESAQEPFDLIVSDTMMPMMGGIELFESLQLVRPHLKLLLISGNAGDRKNHSEVIRRVDLLAKPFSMDVFSAKVRELLESALPEHELFN